MKPLENIFNYLNKNIEYAVLRNWDGLPNNCVSRDIDIVLHRTDYKKVEKKIFQITEECKYYVVQMFKSERFNTIIIANADDNEIIQLDFFFHCSARGIILLDADKMLLGRIFDGKIYHVSNSILFLDKYLFNTVLGQPYPEKYSKILEQNSNNADVKSTLRDLFDTDSIDELKVINPSKLRKRAKHSSYKKYGINLFKNIVNFYLTNLSNFFNPQGYGITFTGPDGVGKTTVLNLVYDNLTKTFSEVEIYHFRPTVIPNLGDALHDVGLKKEVDHDFGNPHRGQKTSKFSSLIRLLYYIFDYQIGYVKKIKKQLYRRNIVIFDRYYTDIVTDSIRSKIFLPPRFVKTMDFLVPKMRYNFLVTADADKILERKKELEKADILSIQKNMALYKDTKGYFLINNETTADDAVNEILYIIFKEQDKRYRRCVKN